MKINYNFKHLKTTLSPKTIKKLQKIEKGEYSLKIDENIVFVFNKDKTIENLKNFRENNPEYSHYDLGSFAFFNKTNNGNFILFFKNITIKKMWRIIHTFGNGLISIQRVKTHYVSCDHFGKIYRKEFFRIWGTCPKYKDTGNYRV